MKEYDRTTRACLFSELRPELIQAVRDYFEKRQLGTFESGVVACCETENRRRAKPGLFARLTGADPDPVHYVAAFLTGERVVWARGGAKSGTVVSSARLRDVEVTDFSSPHVEDSGLSLFGLLDGVAMRSQAFIGLGPGPDADAFRARVKAAKGAAGAQ